MSDKKSSPIKFGTGGWRGIIGDDFIKSNIRLVAYAIALLARERGRDKNPVFIGYDRRFLSQPASVWVAEVLAGMGMKAILMERSAPTPLVMFLVKHNNYDFGIEVTASHNPPAYNGIKLVVEEGRDASVDDTDRVERIIAEHMDDDIPSIPLNKAMEQGLITYMSAPFNDFLDNILAQLNVEAIRRRDLRLLFDPMHGSGIYPLTVILQTARCTVDMINSNKDAYFGGGIPAPTPGRLSELCHGVVEGNYDMGIAFDGDGDRLGVVDEHGNYLDANVILCLLYDYLHRVKGWRGPVVRNLATTHRLDRIAESFGEQCYEVPIGFKYISAAIDAYDAVLGGESSGGLTVRGHIHGKDSVYAASLFIEMVCATGLSPAQLVADLEARFGHYEMVEANLPFEAERKGEIVKTLMIDKRLPEFSAKIIRVGYEDGCKVYFEDGSFVICRFSGTEPLLRIFAEADCAERAQGYIDCFTKMLEL